MSSNEGYFGTALLIGPPSSRRKHFAALLSELVQEVLTVEAIDEALAVLCSSLPEIVICDLELSGSMDIIREIAELRPQLPILVTADRQSQPLVIEALRGGACDWIEALHDQMPPENLAAALQRAEDRQQLAVRSLESRVEHEAFWVAASTAPDGCAVLADDGGIVFSNAEFKKFSDVCAPGEQPSSVVDLLRNQDPAVAEALEREIGQTRGSSLWTAELAVSTGEHRTHFELTLITGNLGQFAALQSLDFSDYRRLVLWVRNITQRKEQERFHRDLLATTSHDLKGPLSAIISSTELLSDPGNLPAADCEKLLARIASCARNSITLIDDVLSMRKIQEGVLTIKPVRLAAAELVGELLEDYHPVAKAKAITFSASPIDPGMQLFADPLGLRRVLGNLISNALKYTPNGGRVEVAVKRLGNTTCFAVSDSGPGIAPHEFRQLFERFGRLDKHRSIDGTGLGLFVTKNIVTAHNGRIEVQSELGAGSTFLVYFPDAPDE